MKGRDKFEDLDGKVILKWLLKKQDMMTQTRFLCDDFCERDIAHSGSTKGRGLD
jgi:hypothetical protein